MLKNILCAAVCALSLCSAAAVCAAPEIIEADGVYVMGDSDTPKTARDAARTEAMRAATERAGIYIESTSEVQGYTLTRDEVRTVAAAVLRVLDEKVTPELVGDAWRYRIHLVWTRTASTSRRLRGTRRSWSVCGRSVTSCARRTRR